MPFDPVAIARLIQRGELKLAQVPQEHRNLVYGVLSSMTDAQAAQIAFREERPRRHLGRSYVKDMRS